MSRRRTVVAVAVASAVTVLPVLTPATRVANAHHCPPAGDVVPTVPPPQGLGIRIVSAYDTVGAGALSSTDAVGCVHGNDVHDGRYIPPRANSVIIVVTAACTPGTTVPAGAVKGLGANSIDIPLKCQPPDRWGNTLYLSGMHRIRNNMAGSITATATLGTTTLSTTYRTLLPTSSPV